MTERRHLWAATGARDVEPAVLPIRHPTAEDRAALAALLLDAFAGGVDVDGSETPARAEEELGDFLDNASEPPLLDQSFVAVDGTEIVAACLVSMWEGAPLIAYTMTAPRWKGRGLVTALMARTLTALADTGQPRVHLWVTAGNAPAERIYERLGFT